MPRHTSEEQPQSRAELQANPASDSAELVIADVLSALQGQFLGEDVQQHLDNGQPVEMQFMTVRDKDGHELSQVKLAVEPNGRVGLAMHIEGSRRRPQKAYDPKDIKRRLDAAQVAPSTVLPTLLAVALRRDEELPGADAFIERTERLDAVTVGERKGADGTKPEGIIHLASRGQLVGVSTESATVAEAMSGPIQKALPRPEVIALKGLGARLTTLHHNYIPTAIRGYDVLMPADGSVQVPIRGSLPFTDPSTPIPNLTAARRGKNGYETRNPIDEHHRLHDDPLVDLRDYGFPSAKSYYAQPNKMTGQPLPGVSDAPLVRQDIARRLVMVETRLRLDPEVRMALGDQQATLRIDDALRPYEVQAYAYQHAWPKILREQYAREHDGAQLSDDDLNSMLPKYIAKPSDRPSPTPHQTGGAVDTWLVNALTGEPFDKGHASGSNIGTANPDFHEGYQRLPGQSDITDIEHIAPADSLTTRVRRVLYWAMRDAGLEVNATEIWHYGSEGDPLGAYMGGTENPYYGVAELPPEYRPKLPQDPAQATINQA